MNTRQALINTLETFWDALKIPFTLFVLGCGGYARYQGMDDVGYIPHTAAVDFSMKPNWLVGKNRDCLGFHNAPDPNRGLIVTVDCPPSFDEQETHNVTVKFWGKTVRPYSNQNDPSGAMHKWRCTRESDGFVCKALD